MILETKIQGKWEWNRIHTFQIDDNYAIGFLEDYNEMICQDKKLEEIRKKTQIDHLTKLYSREYFVQEVERILRKGEGEGELQALFLLDLDYFKQVNDTLGKLLGDRVLQDTGIRLKSIIRKTDMAGRLGGDEFVLFIRHLPHMGAVRKCAEKINAALVNTYGEGERSVTVSASIGIAVVQEEKAFRQLYERADRALYVVKADQRNGYWIEGGGLCNMKPPISGAEHRTVSVGSIFFSGSIFLGGDMVFVFICLIEGGVVAKTTFVAGVCHGKTLRNIMVCQKEPFFRDIFSYSIAGLIPEKMHDV